MKTKASEYYSRVFKALSEPARLEIVSLLAHGESCVCRIEGALRLPQAKVSRHLAYLRREGVVQARRQWKWMHYSLVQPKRREDRKLFSCLVCCLSGKGGTQRRKGDGRAEERC